MIGIAQNIIRSNRDKFGADCLPDDLTFLKVGGRQDRFAAVPFACFLGANDKPSFYVKFSRNPHDCRAIKNEFTSLSNIHKVIKSDFLRNSVPDMFWLNKVPGFTIQSALTGRLMVGEMNDSNVERLGSAALCWLSKFHEETQSGHVLYETFIRKTLPKMKKEMRSYSNEAFSRFSKAFDFVSEFDNENIKIPVVVIHGDFNPHNILADGEKLKVFDWEDSSVSVPFLDVFHFMTVTSFSAVCGKNHKNISMEKMYELNFLENIDSILKQIRNSYGFFDATKSFTKFYVFYLIHMAVNEIRRDRLFNKFDFWANLLDMFVSRTSYENNFIF